MTIDELITFCEEEEHGCRVRCKRYDDASGFTRSKDKSVRTADAITEEVYGDFYKEISATMRKYQKLERDLDKIRAEIAEYGSIWVEYKITGRRDKDIEQLVSDVLSQAKKQVLEIIDKYKAESEVEE